MTMRLLCCSNSSLTTLLLLASTVRHVKANAEKVIFTAPAPVNIPLAKPSLDDLKLQVLGPENWAIRTNLSRVFPSDDAAHGLPAWLLLDNLVEDQRYELRVCWAAIEPTSFTLDVYPLDAVWETPELIQSLADYASSRQEPAVYDQAQQPVVHRPSPDDIKERKASILLLRVQAAADYFTDNRALMENPPPVLVDLILDPYLYNVVPQSLLPTIGYLILLGIVTWFVGQWFASYLINVAGLVDVQKTKTTKKNQ